MRDECGLNAAGLAATRQKFAEKRIEAIDRMLHDHYAMYGIVRSSIWHAILDRLPNINVFAEIRRTTQWDHLSLRYTMLRQFAEEDEPKNLRKCPVAWMLTRAVKHDEVYAVDNIDNDPNIRALIAIPHDRR